MSPVRRRSPRTSRIWLTGIAVSAVLVAGVAAPASARDVGDLTPSATATVTRAGATETGAKSASGRLANSDAELLARSDAAVTPVMVKVDVDPVASYAGGIDGYAATSPELTGVSIADGSAAVAKYTAYVEQKIADSQAEVAALIPGVKTIDSYVTIYGGYAIAIPANRAKDVLKLGSVAAVQSNELRQIAEDTATPTPTPGETTAPATPAPTPSATEAPKATPTPSATPDAAVPETKTTAPAADVVLPPTTPAPDADATTFIGADAVWPKLGGRDKAGQGVIVGVIDTGIWPEHPMLQDNGIPKPAGGPWACEFGDGDVGAAFACNDKLIGAYAFLDTYQAVAQQPAGAADFCAGAVCSARDSEGHGTHTATTAAGSYVASAEVFGVDRGAISGVAPGASVIAYRALGPAGGYEGDLVAAIEQAVVDGVDVINYSISGSGDPYDATELAFLDAYAAGVSINASAGNSGPGPSTLDHTGPWTTTVGASTSDRAFTSALVLTAADGTTYVKQGFTITQGVTGLPVVTAGSLGDQLCQTALPAGSVAGKVVVCVRGGNGRVAKGFNVLQGGAAGMILINPTAMDVETDNHYLPAIHLEGPNTDLLAFLSAHPEATATWAQGEATVAQGDVMAGFSSRGPVSEFLKPDITAPGVQVLAGHTPASTDISTGPKGQLYQAIAGTSMSSPHAAGVSALVKAAHPTWTPGQIKSALMTSSLQSVVNVDGATSGVFDRGAGSIRADRAVAPVLTISESAEDFYASADDPFTRVDLNIPSVLVDPLPGAVAVKRTVTNVSGVSQTFTVKAKSEAGLKITVVPSTFTLAAGKSKDLTIVLDGINAPDGWLEGQVTITPKKSGLSAVVLPVAVDVGEAQVSLTQSCDPTTIARGKTTTCTVAATNFMPVPVPARIDVINNPLLQTTSVTAPATKKALGASWSGTLTPALPAAIDSVAITPGGSPAGYIPLSLFGGTLVIDDLGDEGFANLNVSDFTYGSEVFTSVGVTSNGYLVVGGATSADVSYDPSTATGTAPPNNIVAPLWTDLIVGGGAGGRVLANTLTDGVSDWLVVEWEDVPSWGGPALNTFQVWIGLNGVDDVSMTYRDDADPGTGLAWFVGAENRDGTSVGSLGALPEAEDEVAVKLTPPLAGGAVSFDYTLKGLVKGTWSSTVTLRSDVLRTTPIEQAKITVK
ncbi:S8 family serine peptidase [Microbacterium sp. SS28]|uniref:S8 family serine peptidase n=1 Tax=Microbacterium sp. SS28 TaxID=2919948 RepID=UPI001FA99C61|nr:S8 family serine peptidase [Microbacterium sp. SS28]